MKKKNFAAGLMLILVLFSASPAGGQTYKIVGTGVTVCYNNTTTITCPSGTGEPFYGQQQGTAPAYTKNNDGTITDNITGLMWISARGSKMSWDSAFIMAAQCSTGGFHDWRVPTLKELYSLINFNGKSGATAQTCIPYLDTNYLGWAAGNTAAGERVIDAQDWSATKYKGLTMSGDSTVFGVNFVDGRIKGYPQYQPGTGGTVRQRMYVRFVRGNTGYGKNAFTDNGDSTITDAATGLMWMKNDSRSGMNWQSALAYAQTKNSAGYLGHNDWRLPTAKELQSIVDYTRCKQTTNSGAIDPIFNISSITDEGGTVNWPFFWSNTTHKDNYGAVYLAFGEALGWMNMPPTASYYTLVDVHGAGAQRSDPKSGSYTSYFLGYNQTGGSVYGLGPQGDVIRINNYVRLVRTVSGSTGSLQTPGKAAQYSLEHNYPNPFNPSTTIAFTMPESGMVSLKVYDALNRETAVLVNGALHQGRHAFVFNGSTLSSGVYYCRLTAGNFSAVHKLLLLK